MKENQTIFLKSWTFCINEQLGFEYMLLKNYRSK